MRNEKVLEFLTFTHSSEIGVGEHAEKRVPIDNIKARQVADAFKLNGVVWLPNWMP